MERKVKLFDEEFTVREGKLDCTLDVVSEHGEVGKVSWHSATRKFRG